MKKMILTSDLKQVLGKIEPLFDKPIDQMRFVYITTASNVFADADKGWFFEEMRALQTIGIHLINYDLVGKSEDEVKNRIKEADVVAVSGGNTYYLLEQMRKCNFKSPLVSFLNAGGLYIGCSAGSVVACPAIDFIGDMDDPKEANLTDFTGLDLVPFNIMPHMDHPFFSAKAKEILQLSKNSEIPMIALKDTQALFIQDHWIEIF